MQDKAISSLEEQDSAIDKAVMELLLIEHRGLWAVEEVVREIGDPIDVKDSLARLHGVGLIHRLGGFVLASRAAAHSGRFGGN
jgi:hypothetical protein